MIIVGRLHEGKTRMLIKLANEKIEDYEVYFYNIEESKSILNEMGLDSSVKVLSDRFNTLYDFLNSSDSFNTLYNFLKTSDDESNETDENDKIDENHKPKYYIIDNVELVIKDDAKEVINVLSKFHNISLSYNIGSSGVNC